MITPQQIENKLVDFYLKTTGHYGNSVMRSIDVTTETLTDALDGIEDPINTFENVIKLQETKAFCKFLSNDYTYWGMVSKFRYIVFLCYVAAQDGIESDNFQDKLQEKLGLSSKPQVKGVNTLFNQLLEFTRKNDECRKLEIPKRYQPHMKHIGVIYEFSFPNWRLQSLLTKNLDRNKQYSPEELSRVLSTLNVFQQHEGLYQAI